MRLRLSRRRRVGTHFFEDPVLIDGSIDALDVQIFCLRSWVIKSQPLKGPIFISHLPTWIREQALGEKVDARSDIFAFGCMFYEMLTGVSPFARDSAIASINAVVREEPPRLREVKPDLPCELEKIVHRCLQKDPNRRFQTAADLKVMLQEQKQETSQDRMLRCR